MTPNKDTKSGRDIGDIIRALRQQNFPQHGSVSDCAKKLNVSRGQWSRWESGVSIPGTENQVKIAALFSVSLEELRGDIPLESTVFCENCRRKDDEIVDLNNELKDKNEQLENAEKIIDKLQAKLDFITQREELSPNELFAMFKAMVTGKGGMLPPKKGKRKFIIDTTEYERLVDSLENESEEKEAESSGKD